MSDSKQSSNISDPLPALLAEHDKKLLAIAEEHLNKNSSLREYKETHLLLNAIKRENAQLHYEIQSQTVEIERKKTDLFFYRLNKLLAILIGIGLFSSSFFIFSSSPLLGGIFFGTGLGALGIGTVSIKSVISK